MFPSMFNNLARHISGPRRALVVLRARCEFTLTVSPTGAKVVGKERSPALQELFVR